MSTPVTKKQAIKLAESIKRFTRARDMYDLHESGHTYATIAKNYSLSVTRVRDIVTKYTHKYIN